MLKIVKPLRNGQITIPVEVREKLGIDEQTILQLSLVNKEIRLKPVRISQTDADSPWMKELYGLFSKSRKEAKKYSSKGIEKDITKAINAVRQK